MHVSIVGFQPFFFVNVSKALAEDECNVFVRRLNHRMLIQHGGYGGPPSQEDVQVLSASSVRKKSIWGFCRNDSDFLQIFCSNPEAVRRAASVLRKWDASLEMQATFASTTAFGIFEANVDPITRLSTSSDIVISGWVRVKGGEYDGSEASLSPPSRPPCLSRTQTHVRGAHSLNQS